MSKNQIVNAFINQRKTSRAVSLINVEDIAKCDDAALVTIYSDDGVSRYLEMFSFSCDKKQVEKYKNKISGKGTVAAYRAALPIAIGITAF